MVLLINETCIRCGNVRQVDAKVRICNECLSFEEHEKHREHFERIDKMTLEERVRDIEEWIYQLSNTHPPNL